MPVVAASGQDLQRCRARCVDGIRDLKAKLESRQLAQVIGQTTLCHQPYYLIYDNTDNRELFSDYGDILTQALAGEHPCPSPSPLSRRSGKPRIGFLSGLFSAHSNALAFEGLIRHLDRSRFESVLLHLHTTHTDAMKLRMDGHADQAITLAPSLQEARQQILDQSLDLLFYTDLGLHPVPTLLACSRLAPVQITGWGVPHTSGMPEIDYYISGAMAEPADADAHYRETLVRLPGLPCCFLSDNLIRATRSRDYFFMPQDVPLLACLQALHKIHPDFDPVLEAIACRLPTAHFLLSEAGTTSHTQILLDRLRQNAPTAFERLIVLQHMPREDYIALVAEVDLMLDPPYFSSGITLYETLHLGTPIVTLRGQFLRSHFVAGAYRLIGLPDAPVADNLGHYVELVVGLIQDPARLAALKAEIAWRAREHLYDRLDVVRGFEDFVAQVVADSRAREPQGQG